ncbi:MopE-related protein [Flavisericum labens]|uniref:MopE-related protein n=1 Tax=Flavisericum labens TaxID=3377112 RepID=UPI00387A9D4A
MKRIVVFMIAVFLSYHVFPQCENTEEYLNPIPGGVDINDGEEHQIAPGIAAGEYVVINGLNASNHYRFTSNRTNIPNADYITIYDASNNNLLANKTTPLELDPINATSIEIHINLDAGCVTDDEFHDLTIQNLTNATCNMPGAPGGITYKSDDQIDFYWGAPALSTPTGYDWRVVLAGNDPDTFVASGSTVAPTTNASTGAVLSAGTSYHIYVRSTCSGGQESGWFKFPPTYITNTVEPPSNDFCEGAISIVQELNIAGVGDATAIPGNLAGGAGTNVDAETCGGRKGNARDDVWYTFIAQTNDVHVNLDPTFDGVLTLYSGNCNSLSYLACADTPSETLSDEEIYTGSLNLGQRYYLRVYFYGTTTPLNPTFNLKIWSDTAVTDNDNDGYADHPNLDCDDGNAAINPGATELCDGLDNDCDGQTDEGLTTIDYYPDMDEDGYGDASANPISVCSAQQPDQTVTNNDDCDDTDAAVNPATTEILDNLKDDDCDPSTPDSSADTDDDGDGYSENDGDCDDTKININPGASEIPDNGVDEDCDGSDIKTWYLDADNDGYGDADQTILANTKPESYVSNSSDCNDTEATINPEATETVGNGIDENCDGLFLWYQDNDNDGYGSAVVIQSSNSSAGEGEADNDSDCSDVNAAINPDATDTVANGIDENCDGQYLWYQDSDEDGYGTSIIVQSGNNNPGQGEANNTSDCNDENAAINPGANEICDNIDNDCNALVDEDDSNLDVNSQSVWFEDFDNDGYGNANSSLLACSQPLGYVANDFDCNDTNEAINPDATEDPANGVDDNCDGETDETLSTDEFRFKNVIVRPNPFNYRIIVEIPNLNHNKVNISLLDLNGRIILCYDLADISDDLIEIDHLENLQNGIYLLKISTHVNSEKIIKRVVKL